MSQSSYTLANSDGATFRTALNTLFAAIQTANSGSTAPASPTAYMIWADTSTGTLKQRDAANANWVSMGPLAAPATPTGTLAPFVGRTAPTGWLVCSGAAVSRTTYADLYAVMCPSLGTFTVTIAAPGVFTIASHGLQLGDRIRLTTTGALPTGLTANTDYYVVAVPTTSTFQLSATAGGTAITTSGTQSGTHSARFFAYGAGDGSTTFNLPDMRGRVPAGADAMGGTAAARLTAAGSGLIGAGMGQTGGAETHTLTSAQIPAHAHPVNGGNAYSLLRTTGGSSGFTTGTGLIDSVTNTSSNTGGGGAHNNTQPTLVAAYIVKT